MGVAMARRPIARGDLTGSARYSKNACAKRLVALRAAIGIIEGRKITQTEFATRAGLTQSAYTHYENALRIPSIEAATALVDTYDISMDWLFLGYDHNMPFELNTALKKVSSGL